MGRLRVPRTSQPQGPAGIDWGNPSAPIAAVLPSGGVPLIFSRGNAERYGVPTGTGVRIGAGQKGLCAGSASASSTNTFRLHSVANLTNTVWESPTTAVSALVYLTRTGTSSGQSPIFANADTGTSPAWGISQQTTTMRFDTQIGGVAKTSPTASINVGETAVFIGVYDGVNVSLYKNGKLVGSTAATGSLTYVNAADRGPLLGNYYNYTGTARSFVGDIYVASLWKRALSASEIKSLSDNPWQIFQPLARNVFSDVPATGGSHATSGALTGAGSTLSGTAARFRAFATSGALAPTGAEITGTAVHNIPHATSGALAPTGAEIVGAAARASPGFITHDTSGALATIGAEAAGTAARFRAMATSGALATSGAEITGSAARFRAFDTSGVLTNAGATITGSANRYREMGTSGALATAGAAVVGTSLRYRTMGSSGALVTAGATVAGTAARFRAHGTSGALAAAGASITGSALRLTPGGGVYPNPADVRAGVIYGPTGAEFTGTMSILLDLNTGRLVKIIGQKVALLL